MTQVTCTCLYCSSSMELLYVDNYKEIFFMRYKLLNDFTEVQCIYSQTINNEKHHREILANVVQKVFNLSCI